MLDVVFTHIDDNVIKKFERIDFTDAVKQTAALEKKYRDMKKKINGDFYVIEKNSDEPIYRGTIEFGSHYAPNLYIHIKKKMEEMRLSKQQEQERIGLFAKMEEGLPDEFKEDEIIENAHLLDLDISRISRLVKWQRRSVYIASVGLIFIFVCISVYLFVLFAQSDVAYQEQKNVVEEQQQIMTVYEEGLSGNKDAVLENLEKKKDDLTDSSKKVLAYLYLQDERYKEIVGLYNNDVGFIATFISTSGSIDQLKEFNENFPSPEGNFDVLYSENKYEELLKVNDVKMTVKRSEMKTYALMKTGRIEEAKEELKNNNNEDLESKLTQYETLHIELDELKEAIEISKESNKQDDVESLEEKKSEIEDKMEKM